MQNVSLGLEDQDHVRVLGIKVLDVPAIKRSFLLTPFKMGQFVTIEDDCMREAPSDHDGSYRTETNMLLQTMSHFSLAASKGQLLLVDPCLVDHRLISGARLHYLVSKADKMSVGRVMQFIQRHRCNKYCRVLRLPSVQELFQSCLDVFGTNDMRSRLSTHIQAQMSLHSPIDGMGHTASVQSLQPSGGQGGGFWRDHEYAQAQAWSIIRPMTAAILDHPHPDLDDLLASQPWSYYKMWVAGSPVKLVKSVHSSPGKSVESETVHPKTKADFTANTQQPLKDAKKTWHPNPVQTVVSDSPENSPAPGFHSSASGRRSTSPQKEGRDIEEAEMSRITRSLVASQHCTNEKEIDHTASPVQVIAETSVLSRLTTDSSILVASDLESKEIHEQVRSPSPRTLENMERRERERARRTREAARASMVSYHLHFDVLAVSSLERSCILGSLLIFTV